MCLFDIVKKGVLHTFIKDRVTAAPQQPAKSPQSDKTFVQVRQQ